MTDYDSDLAPGQVEEIGNEKFYLQVPTYKPGLPFFYKGLV